MNSAQLLLLIFIDCERRFDQFDVPSEIAQLAYAQSESIDYANWPIAIGPLIERMAVNLSLKKRPDADEYPKADAAKARTQPLADQELSSILKYDDYEGWYVDNFGNTDVRYLVKTFKFPISIKRQISWNWSRITLECWTIIPNGGMYSIT